MKIRLLVAFFAGLAFGVALTFLLVRLPGAHSVPGKWYALERSGSQGLGVRGVSYATEASFGVDISLPRVGDITGEAKFVPMSSNSTSVQLGYRIKIPVAPLDTAKIPAKYRQRVRYPDGSELLPTEQVVYEALFEFRLKDRDGFALQKITSEPHHIYSGETNSFQGIAAVPVYAMNARRVTGVEVNMFVQRCVTCRQ